MGKLHEDEAFVEVLASHMRPGDEGALLRFSAALEDMRKGVAGISGHRVRSWLAASATGTASEYAHEAGLAVVRIDWGQRLKPKS
jgi:hypothetical protein